MSKVVAAAALVTVCITSAFAQSSGAAVGDVMRGQLVVLGIAFVLFGGIYVATEARVRRIVQVELNDPSSALARHQIDPHAHEMMRSAMAEALGERLLSIERLIATNRTETREEAQAFRRDILQPIIESNKQTLALLATTMERERRFTVRADDPKT